MLILNIGKICFEIMEGAVINKYYDFLSIHCKNDHNQNFQMTLHTDRTYV